MFFFLTRLRRVRGPWAVVLFYLFLTFLSFSLTTRWRGFPTSDENMFLFVIPLLLGFTLVGASAFSAAYSRWFGERRGELVTSILRNYLGIPLGVLGLILAWLQPTALLFSAGWAAKSLGWLLVIAGSIPLVWGHAVLGLPTGWPSIRDVLVRHSLYAYVRHPIYAGGLLMFVGGVLLKPTATWSGMRTGIYLAYRTSAVGRNRFSGAFAPVPRIHEGGTALCASSSVRES
jgi:Phospholipid methyltransferase